MIQADIPYTADTGEKLVNETFGPKVSLTSFSPVSAVYGMSAWIIPRF